eukprot:CAMPEP_0204002282 /NCGR_PEP_ID=MMETSP0360-20130528/16807_1 /ASSEMBLY_ACC=CAM_ASM_000342 /TAXON_ID=268821 /ORGANISM="Scrippsiella Hangoei, Strain SHTV-5" /LENGTH=122 /DNA_ID=CAMNT_0050943875 /DNA_START=58 /DNA_END=422 /DNA_ORIENTATION=+
MEARDLHLADQLFQPQDLVRLAEALLLRNRQLLPGPPHLPQRLLVHGLEELNPLLLGLHELLQAVGVLTTEVERIRRLGTGAVLGAEHAHRGNALQTVRAKLGGCAGDIEALCVSNTSNDLR